MYHIFQIQSQNFEKHDPWKITQYTSTHAWLYNIMLFKYSIWSTIVYLFTREMFALAL